MTARQGELWRCSQSFRGMRWLPLLLLAGCLGRLSNEPLTVGTVSGQLVGAESAKAMVFLLGYPEFTVSTNSAGQFALAAVPVGDYQVLAVGPTTALSATVHVASGGTAEPSSVSMTGASPVSVSVSSGGAPLDGVLVGIEGTPLAATSMEGGIAHLGVLPAGCFKFSVSWQGLTEACSLCAAPPLASSCELDFPGPVDAGPVDAGPEDAGPVDAGPVDAGFVDAGPTDAGLVDGGSPCDQGCSNSQVCDPTDDLCYDCVAPTDCGPGNVCVSHLCTSALASCQPCVSSLDCPQPSICAEIDGGPQECVVPCIRDDDCNQGGRWGFQCSTAGLCVPSPDEISLCISLGALGAQCQSDADCTNAGLVQGICEQIDSMGWVCTVSCDGSGNSGVCPKYGSCQWDGARNYCHP